MAGIKDNRRIIYTKNLIKQNILELLEIKQIHEITVTDICKRANLNRGTFYTHYKDAFDLLQSIEDEFFDKALEYINTIPVTINKDLLMIKVLEHIKENEKFSKILFLKQRDTRILNRIFSIASKVDFETLIIKAEGFDKRYLDYLIKYTVSGTISIVQTWLENDFKESIEDIIEIMNSINKFTKYI